MVWKRIRGVVHVVTVRVLRPGDRVNGRPVAPDQVAVSWEDMNGAVTVYASPESMQRLLVAALDEVDKLVTVRASARRLREQRGLVPGPIVIEVEQGGGRRGIGT